MKSGVSGVIFLIQGNSPADPFQVVLGVSAAKGQVYRLHEQQLDRFCNLVHGPCANAQNCGMLGSKEETVNQLTTARPFPPEAASKRMIALRYWLLGASLHRALIALDFNQPYFGGLRKDGLTPKFDHHVAQANFVRTLLPYLMFPEETLCVVFFHDTAEDHGVSRTEIAAVFSDSDFGKRVADGVWRMTKKYRGGVGSAATPSELFAEMARCPISSIAKGVDRIHNLQSMVGVFTLEKQKAYLLETEEFFLPMLKRAEQAFPSQEPAYKIIRTFLKMQMELIRAGHHQPAQ